MEYEEGDAVRMKSAPEQKGVVTGDRHKDFPSMIGVRWSYSGDFGFLRPALIEPAEPAAVPQMSIADRAAIDRAQRLAAITLDRLESEVGIVYAGNHNRTESGIEVADRIPALDRLATQLKRAYDLACYNDGHADHAWRAVAYAAKQSARDTAQ